MRQWLEERLEAEIQVVYVSPLKALSNDIERNLRQPLAELGQICSQAGMDALPIRAAVRTGDTPSSERQAMMRRPPHILVTTPESLYLLLTSERGRERLRTVRTVIVDEIHAMARDKRGSHLALSLERLTELADQPFTRIGLSATQKPIQEIANFLVGDRSSDDAADKCRVVDAGHSRDLDLAIEVPPTELSAVCSHEQWAEIYERMTQLINSHRSTLIFVNTRRLAERVAHALRDILGEEAVAAHHGSLSRRIRLSVEHRLKSGDLRAIVATASLELGIDIGFIDLVCQIGSPRSIATFLQRVGRSGHSLGLTPKGRLFPLTRDELLESLSLVKAVRQNDLDQIEMPDKPLDILAQQVIAEVACRQWDEKQLYELCRRAWPYRRLTQDEFQTVLTMVSEGVAPQSRRGAYLQRDRINGVLSARRSARLAAVTSGGAIPETAEYRVVTEEDKTLVGTLDEDFAIESLPGDVFLLGNSSWRIRHIRGGEVVVNDANGAPPSIPFWFGEAPGRTVELSREVARMRSEIADRLSQIDQVAIECDGKDLSLAAASACHEWLQQVCGADYWGADQAIRYVSAQKAAIGLIPTQQEIVFERFFDESGGMQLVIHAPLGSRINRAWGLALRKRFCRSFDFELQAAATDNGILLSMGPQHSVPVKDLFGILRTDNGRHLLEQAMLAAPMFQVRWRWNVTRALAVLRRDGGKKVPPHLQRFRADDLLAAVFPQTVGCLENHHGDVPIPEHPLVGQTVHDCMHEAMDIDGWLDVLAGIEAGRIKLIARDTREPSPFSHELLNANPYAFLDDAPLEERRTRAVAARRTLSPEAFDNLSQLDPEAILQVRRAAWPVVRDANELHDAMMSLCLVHEHEMEDWKDWIGQLVASGRATSVRLPGFHDRYWIAAERLPLLEAIHGALVCEPPVELPAELQTAFDERSRAWVELVRGRVQHSGPTTAEQLAKSVCLDSDCVATSLEALEGEGIVLRGRFTSNTRPDSSETSGEGQDKSPSIEWCDRRLLARIHRLTLEGLRRQIEPVEPADYLRFLVQHHHLDSVEPSIGSAGVRETIKQLQGFDLPAGAWEGHILSSRMHDYDPQWLDQLFLAGEVIWGRLRPPRHNQNEARRKMALLTRTVPISLMLREDLAWLLHAAFTDQERQNGVSAATAPDVGEVPSLGAYAREVLETLRARGALFLQELKATTQILPSHLEQAFRELAAHGLITSDAFGTVRSIVAADRHRRRRSHSRRRHSPQQHLLRRESTSAAAAGRWSLFPGSVPAVEDSERLQRWCQQLLLRYGVVFRDLLTRESAAPRWFDLVRVFRQLELRGEVRGGRFVAGVAGEQFATEQAVQHLRRVRDSEQTGRWIVLSAADPLNLVGIITDDERVPATAKNNLILQDGRLVATKQARQIEFIVDVKPEERAEMYRALQTGRRPTVTKQAQKLLSFTS